MIDFYFFTEYTSINFSTYQVFFCSFLLILVLFLRVSTDEGKVILPNVIPFFRCNGLRLGVVLGRVVWDRGMRGYVAGGGWCRVRVVWCAWFRV